MQAVAWGLAGAFVVGLLGFVWWVLLKAAGVVEAVICEIFRPWTGPPWGGN